MKKNITFFKPIQNSCGVTIVEIVIAAFILILIVAFTLQAFVGQKDADNIQAQVVEAQQAAAFSLQELTVSIRNAGFQVPFGTPVYRIKPGTAGHDTLILYNKNGAGVDSTRYFLDHTTDAAHPALKKKLNTGSASIFAENIEDVDFLPVGPGSPTTAKQLTISLTARTEDIDKHLNDYRRRTVSSDVVILNAE
jgi:hypothetical protein